MCYFHFYLTHLQCVPVTANQSVQPTPPSSAALLFLHPSYPRNFVTLYCIQGFATDKSRRHRFVSYVAMSTTTFLRCTAHVSLVIFLRYFWSFWYGSVRHALSHLWLQLKLGSVKTTSKSLIRVAVYPMHCIVVREISCEVDIRLSLNVVFFKIELQRCKQWCLRVFLCCCWFFNCARVACA